MSTETQQEPFLTRIPARLDRLPWSRFHWLVVAALGITWILDGLEVTLKGAISGVLQQPGVMGFSPEQIGAIASAYLTGAVLGALVFGYLTDRWGRKKLFSITLGVYLLGVLLTALSWNLSSFALFRFLTGAGIGGEYAAINSAIDELIPAKYRGRIDLAINGSYWIGAALGSGATLIILDPKVFPLFWGWRVGFGIGAVIGLFILLLREFVPESPRWLMTHGRQEEAEAVMRGIESSIEDDHGGALEPPAGNGVLIHPGRRFGFGAAAKAIFVRYKKRSFLGLSLMVSQAFLYNAIFFTYALVLTKFYKVSPEKTGLYLLPFAIGNFLGPLLLGRYFDTIGRRQMIAGTYAISALLLTATGWLFLHHDLSAASQTGLWSVIFFFASAAASSAYLTVSEIFPLEIRAVAIALFFAVGTGAGGIAAPWLFGALIGSGSRGEVFAGYAFASILMLGAAVVAAAWGVKAERAGLEEIAEPLSAS